MADYTTTQQQALAIARARQAQAMAAQQASEPAMTGGEIPGPRRSYSLAEVPVEAIKNVPESAGKFVGGVVQAVTSPVQTIKGILDVGAGALRNALPESVVNFIDQFDTNPEATQRAVMTANAVGGMYKDRYGSYDAIKRTFAEDPVGAAADLSTLLSGGGTAATKLGMTQTGAALTKVGAAINPMRPIAAVGRTALDAAKTGGVLIESVVNPKNALYMRAAEGRAPEIINALRQAEEIVPGSQPTAAQAAAKTGVVGFQKMGKTASQVTGMESAYAARAEAQKAAQLAAVRQVGKTPAELKAAEAVREATAKQLYGIADEALLPGRERQFEAVQTGTVKGGAPLKEVETGVPIMTEIGRDSLTNTPIMAPVTSVGGQPIYKHVLNGYKYDPQLANLMERPAIQAAFDSAATIAANRGVSMFTAEGKLTGQGAHLVKLALDDAITPTPGTPLAKNTASAINSAKSSYLNWVEDKVPAYKTARETFAAQSKPINQMEVGQFLEGKLRPALGEETARLRAAGYAGALENAPGTIKRATGQARYENLSEILTPDQIKIVEDVRADLARGAKSEILSKGAVDPTLDVRRASATLAGEAALPNMINRITTVANFLLSKLRGKMDHSVAMEVATEMLFPGKAADALEKAYKQQQKINMIESAGMAPFRAIGKTPAAVNMLAPAYEVQNALTTEQ